MENTLIYIPLDYRQRNIRASCVHASVCNCMKTANLWQEAEEYWNKYKGDPNGEGAGSISDKLTRFGIKHKIVRSEAFLIESLRAGRGAAVTWGGAHVVNLVGKINGNAYIVDNQRVQRHIVQPWSSFLREFRRCGGWAVVILDGKVRRPYDAKNLDGLDD